MFFEEFLISASFVVETLKLSDRNDFHHVLVTGFVFGQEHQLVSTTVFGGIVLTGEVFADKNFCANDRLNTVFFSLDIKLNRSIHSTGVGESKRSHAEGFGLIKKIFYFWKSGEEGIVRVSVKMDERHRDFIL